MTPELSIAAAAPVPGSAVCDAIARRYAESAAHRWGISPEQFEQFISAVVLRYAGTSAEAEQVALVGLLHVEELALARACTAGNEAAWEAFLIRFRAPLYETAYRLVKDEANGRDLADELYADLYGIADAGGKRTSKLDYYMGRGSLEGWLRTVLSQRFVDRARSSARTVSLEQQAEAGAMFAAPPSSNEAPPDNRLARALQQTLAEVNGEERFLLASYYLDQRTLAEIGRTLGVHESTISRRLERVIAHLRKSVRSRLRTMGINARQCDEMLHDLDVRDLNVNLADKLRQESVPEPFYRKDGSKA